MKLNQLFLPIAFTFFTLNLNAQIIQSANFIKGGVDDAKKVVEAYLLPLEYAVGVNEIQSNSFLYKHEGKRKWNFGIGLDLTTAFVDPKDNTYNFNDLQLENFHPSDPNQVIAQTISGNEQTIELESNLTYSIPIATAPFLIDKPILSLKSPEGKNLNIVPYARMHFVVENNGNFIEFKLLPSFKLADNTFGIYAIGGTVQHNIESSLSFIESLPFDLYFLSGYNYNRITYFLDIKPDEDQLSFTNPTDEKDYENQVFEMSSSSIPIQLSIVKAVKNFSFSLTSGYNLIFSSVKMKGNYPVYRSDPTNTFNVVVDNFSDPLKYDRTFHHFFIGFGATYRTDHFNLGLKYNHSNYKNITLSLAVMF